MFPYSGDTELIAAEWEVVTLKGLARMSRGISLNEVMVVTTHKMKINRTIVNTKRT